MKNVYIPKGININNFITSLLLYDKITCTTGTFICYILTNIPKRFHQFILELDFIEIYGIYARDPLEMWYDEMKCHYMAYYEYSEKEFDEFAEKLRNKIKLYMRKNMDEKLLLQLMSDKNGEFYNSTDYMELYDAIKSLTTNYYAINDRNLLDSNINFEKIRIDMGNNNRIFEINRMPDLSKDIAIGNFNFEEYISLRDKEGAKILREVIFKEKNYNHPDELLKEYNDIVLREGLYSNKKQERSFWGLSNGLSLAGILSGNIILTIAITLISVLSGNYRILYKTKNDKLEDFIKEDLRNFINTISK
jgi:hypothetical protein